MIKRVLLSAWMLFSVSVAQATVTIQWDCNQEADMQDYRVERSSDAGQYWGVLREVSHPTPCQSPVMTQDTTYLKPGEKLYRLFARDKSGQVSEASRSAAITIPISPIGNPGGQAEQPLPPSPMPPPVTPPPPVVVPPPPPVVVKPGDVTGFASRSITHDSAIIDGTVPAGAKVNVRHGKAPLSWGSATSAACETLPCTITGLTPDTLHEAQCIPYFGTMNQGAIYGNFCPSITFKTLPLITPPPPPVVPPPPPTVTLLQALQSGLDTCLTKKLAHMACMKALRDALGKVNP